jgi:hypothetical protein
MQNVLHIVSIARKARVGLNLEMDVKITRRSTPQARCASPADTQSIAVVNSGRDINVIALIGHHPAIT